MNIYIKAAIFFLNFIFLLIEVRSIIRYSTAVRRTNMDERILHKRLLWILKVEGLGPCIGECSRDVQCASVFFNKATKICQGHSITHGHSDGAEVNNNTRYYVQPFGLYILYLTCLDKTDRSKPSEPATFVQRLPNVFQTPWTFGIR